MVDIERVRESWDRVAAYGDQVPLRFYSRLFVMAPELRDMFPLSMVVQRDRFFRALGHTVSRVDDLPQLVPYLQQLGRDHRRFGAEREHYAPVGEALLATLADYLGDDWTPELEHDWAQAYELVGKAMVEAANEAAVTAPAWWSAEVVDHERRTFDVAVLTVQPDLPYEFVPGQSLALEVPTQPRLWRYYSPANAPRADGSLELHVRRAPGGRVSVGLVDDVEKGDVVRLGPPVGDRLTLQHRRARDLVLIAGGTGLAPLKALVDQLARAAAAAGASSTAAATGSPIEEQLAADAGPRPEDQLAATATATGTGTGNQFAAGYATGTVPSVAVFFGVRTARELYDLDALRVVEGQHSWLRVTPALSDDPYVPLSEARGAEPGNVAEVALRHGPWPDHDIYVCGGDQMVLSTVQLLRRAGCPSERIHYEGFQGLGGEPYGVPDL